jgi:transposase
MMQVLENVLSREIELPADISSCHALILELLERLDGKESDILCLKQRLQNLLRDRFGRSSEKLSPGQLLLFAQELTEILGREAATEQEQANGEQPSKQIEPRKKHGGGGRKPIPANVPRERKHYFPTEEQMVCQGCHASKTEIGIEIVEQLDYVPASFKVIEHCTHKFACKSCQEGVVQGKRPEQIHSGGRPTEGVIAQISTAKFADHLPLNRQEQIYAREGVWSHARNSS